MIRLNTGRVRLGLLALVAAVFMACGTPAPTGDAAVQGSAAQADVLVHPEWTKNATIYEVNLRQHTAEGTIQAFIGAIKFAIGVLKFFIENWRIILPILIVAKGYMMIMAAATMYQARAMQAQTAATLQQIGKVPLGCAMTLLSRL